MTTDLITALQTHGQQHKGTDLGGVLQWAILHIQNQDTAKKSEQEKTLRNVIAKMDALKADFEKVADTQMVKERREKLAYEFDIEYRHLGRRVRIIKAELAAISTLAIRSNAQKNETRPVHKV